MKMIWTASFCLAPFFACGGGGGGGTHVTVDGKPSGSGSGSGSDSGSGSGSGSNAACQALSTYAPNFGSGDQSAIDLPQHAGSGSSAGRVHQQLYLGSLDQTNPGDFLDIELYATYGGFGSGDVANGTYALTGDDIDYGSCGVCVVLWPKLAYDGSSGKLTGLTNDYVNTQQYIASAGSLTLTSVSGTLTGSISGVTFKHINLDASSGDQSYPDSCASTITSASFSTLLQQGSAAATLVATGTTDTGAPVRVHLRNRHR